jgi:hypothetical protein
MHETDNPTLPPLSVLLALRLDWWNRQPKHSGGPWKGPLYLLGDEPTPFCPLYEWEKHLDLLLSLDPDSTQAQRMVEDAVKTMRWIERRDATAEAERERRTQEIEKAIRDRVKELTADPEKQL